MSYIKKQIKNVFSFIGYDIARNDSSNAKFDNFQNLTQAYELQMRDLNGFACPVGNPIRVQLLARLLGTKPSQAYEIISALNQTLNVEGDVCEFGVAQGETSALIANEISGQSKMLHLFDSFEGLPAPTEKDRLKDDIFSLGSMQAYQGEMSCPIDMVMSRMAMIEFPLSRYVIHQGFIEELIEESSNFPEKVSFAFVDFDFYEPIKIALEFLDKALNRGGMIMVDDYDFFSTGAKIATDEFVQTMNAEELRYKLLVADKRLGCFAILVKL